MECTPNPPNYNPPIRRKPRNYLIFTEDGEMLGECSLLRKLGLYTCKLADNGRDCTTCWCG